jgi:hypothetical protein
MIIKNLKQCLSIGLFLAAATLSARAGSFFSDFNSGTLPPGTHANSSGSGGAYLEPTGGVGDSGCFKITKNINDQHGSLILDDLDGGNPIYGFDATFKLRIGGGGSTPADGMAFCVAPDLSDTSMWDERGAGSGIRICWATYPYTGATPSDPSVEVRAGGTLLTWKGYSVAALSTGGTDANTWWADVHIRLNADGSLNLDYQGVTVLTNFFIPGYQGLIDQGLPMRFGIGGRTGGANDNFWIDNLSITTFTNPMVGFSQQPFPQTVQQGDDVDFDVRVGNVNGVTYQWYSNNVQIAGATAPTLTIKNVQPAASGAKIKATATGPNNTATSTEVTLTVTDLHPPTSPQMAFNFNDGLTPAGVTLTGTAAVDVSGGTANSGCVKLVNPAGSAAMLVADSTPTAPIYGFTARFKILVGGGTVPPADGFVFGFGSDIPDSPSGDFESGVGLGTGLRVTFDIYNNDSVFGFAQYEDTLAPSIDVRYGSQVVGTVHLPISFMETGLNEDTTPAYKDCIIQLNTDGTLNVVYHGALVFNHLVIPGFASVGPSSNTTGSRFAIAARTGGLNDNIWLDDFELTTATTSGSVRITQSPVNQTILVNHALTNTVALNDPTGVTYQWFRGPNAITGATDSTYVLPSVTVGDSGASFTVQATKASVTVTSAPAVLTVANLTAPTNPNLTFTFDDGQVPAGTAIYGTGDTANGLPPGGFITANGGVGDSGVFHITDNVNGQQGAFVVNSLYSGAQVTAIAASWDLRLGGGSGNPADGYSFNFASDLSSNAGGNETGNGTGLSVCWDIYGAWTDGSPAPAVNIKYKGTIIASVLYAKPDIQTGSDFRTVLLRVDPDGKLYLSYGERVLFNGLQLPNYTYVANGRFGFYGRTGGENENQWVDNVKIQATKNSAPLSVTAQPANALVIVGQAATFSVSLSDPNGATYQWYKNTVLINGVNGSSYTTPATTPADNGALFYVKATGPGGTATSSNAMLTVVSPITISNPTVTYDFNDCALPAGTILNFSNPNGQNPGGGGYIACTGGVGDSGCLHLTDNANDCHAAFIMPDPNNNAYISALTAHFAVRVADGSGTPADGFSFVWAPTNNIPDNVIFGQDGTGLGLTVGFDTYNNSGEAPSFNVWYHGTQLANKHVPYSSLWTGNLGSDPTNQFADCFIRVNANGTLDLQYKGNAIFNGLPLPGYGAMAGGRFAIGAQTGGENETHWFDNIQIATTLGLVPVPIGITGSGNNTKLTWSGTGWLLESTDSLQPPIQWTPIPGATSPYPLPLTGKGLFYRLVPQ